MSKNKRIKAILEAFDTEPRPMMFSIVMSSYDNREQVLDILAQLALPQYVNAEFEVILIDSHFENDDGVWSYCSAVILLIMSLWLQGCTTQWLHFGIEREVRCITSKRNAEVPGGHAISQSH
jgi:hypothetical protein